MEMEENQENQELVYETNEKGERELVRSKVSTKKAFLRFYNRTNRPVTVWWRDFRGVKKEYTTLEARQYYDITTYITHPWQFSDAASNEEYVINNKTVFTAPPNIGDMRHRTIWNITIPVRTLRSSVLLAIASKLRDPSAVDTLELPYILAKELKDQVDVLSRYPAA